MAKGFYHFAILLFLSAFVIRLGLERFSALPMYLRFPRGQFFTVSDLRYFEG